MKYLRQLAIIFAFCVFGQFLSSLLGNAMPGNVLGMILMFLFLAAGFLKQNQVGETADFFLNNMAFFFLPSCLGILSIYAQIQSDLLPILAVILLTTLLTAAATAGTVHLILWLQLRHLQAKRHLRHEQEEQA